VSMAGGWRVAACALALTLTAVTCGAEAASSRGFVISPAFAQLEVRTSQSQVLYALSLRNLTAVDQSFRLSVVDFGSLDEEGGVAFLGQPATEMEHRYGLASWMTLERELVFIPAGEAVQVKATIENKQSLAPGGHYGAILATAVTDTGQAATDPRVGIKQVLSSLVLVAKEGGAVPVLKLASQHHDGGWWLLPRMVDHRFQNAGNVHLVPRGTVEVKSPVGAVVKRGALNEASSVILPESFRRYKTPLLAVASALFPGWYTVVTKYRYDGTEQTKTLVSSFWYAGTIVGWAVILVVMLAVFGGVWGWRRGVRLRVPGLRRKRT